MPAITCPHGRHGCCRRFIETERAAWVVSSWLTLSWGWTTPCWRESLHKRTKTLHRHQFTYSVQLLRQCKRHRCHLLVIQYLPDHQPVNSSSRNHQSIQPIISPSVNVSMMHPHVPICLSLCLPACLFVYVYLSIYLSVYLAIYLPTDLCNTIAVCSPIDPYPGWIYSILSYF